MYGTVTRMQVKPGQVETLKALQRQWLCERQPEAAGFIADYVLQSKRMPASGSFW